MIYRPNYDDVQAFLVYHREVMQHDPQTVNRYWVSLRVLLEWSDAAPLPAARSVRPPVIRYIMPARSGRRPSGKCAGA